MKKTSIVLFLLLTTYFLGCNKNNITNPMPTSTNNIPIIANAPNAFSFVLAANSYTSSTDFNVSFTTDSLACSIVISNQTSGNASLAILDSNNAVVYSDSLLNNQVLAFTQANRGIPKLIKLDFTGYTGTLSFALSRNNAKTK
jgi:hypothetical protein